MPLLVMAFAFALLFVTLHLAAMRNEILRRRVRTLMLMQAQAAPGAKREHRISGPHAELHRGAYGVARLVHASSLIAWIVLDYRAQRRALGELESRGVTRRSVQAKTPA